jgi:hypothetical protein
MRWIALTVISPDWPVASKGALYGAYVLTLMAVPAPVRLGPRHLRSFLTGSLDEVAIYPRKLTPAEGRQHFR